MEKQKKIPLALAIRFDVSPHQGLTREAYFHCSVSVVQDQPGKYDADRPFDYFDSYTAEGLRFIKLHAQGNSPAHDGTGFDCPDWYSESFHLDDGSTKGLREENAELAFNTMRSVRKKLGRMDKEEGYSKDFGVTVNRLARALKIKKIYAIGWKRRTDYGPYSTHDLAGIRGDIESWLHQKRADYKKDSLLAVNKI